MLIRNSLRLFVSVFPCLQMDEYESNKFWSVYMLMQLPSSLISFVQLIGVEGGFTDQEPEYDGTFEIVILPEFISLPFPSVDLPEKVGLAVDRVILAESADRKQQLASWVADKKNISSYATELHQLDNGVIVPPTGWKCSKCDKTENLWLNLTDGMILCGRWLWDGTGGNNHAVEHYQQTKYPLAIKLGTITADLEAAAQLFTHTRRMIVLKIHY